MHLDCLGILFDSDGVLVDSHDLVAQAWSQLASEFDLDIDVLLAELAGVRAVDTLGRYLDPDTTDVAVARLEDLEVDLAASTRGLAGAAGLLATLPTASWTVVTSASRRLALARLHGAGIPMPLQFVTADDVTRGKPDPEPFLRGAELVGHESARCVVFEDSPSGGAAATAAGATVVAVGSQAWPAPPAARVVDLTCVTVVSTETGLRIELDQ